MGPSGTRTFTWDYEDRLTNLSGGGVSSTNYGYNGLGTRTSKSNSSGSRTYKRNGVGVTAPVLSDGVASMVPGISEKSGGVTSFTHTDRLGSMKGLSASGALTDTANYDAFGMVVSRTGTSSTQKGFASGFGYQEDGESGYKLLGHRYYDPETGRFLSRDPVRAGRNWFAYCDNNPLSSIDPTGLDHWVIIEGNTSNWYDQGEQEIILQQLIRWLEANGHTYEIVSIDNRDEAISDLKDCDSFVFLGHGTEDGSTIAGNNTVDSEWAFDQAFMDDVIAARKGVGFDRIWLFCCHGGGQASFFVQYCNQVHSWNGGLNKWNSAAFLQLLGKENRKRKRLPQVKPKSAFTTPVKLPVHTKAKGGQ